MKIEVYAIRDNSIKQDRVDQLGYGASFSLASTEGARKIVLDVADGTKVWEENGKVKIDEGNGAGILRTFDGKVVLSIPGYYGDTNKSLRIMAIE